VAVLEQVAVHGSSVPGRGRCDIGRTA